MSAVKMDELMGASAQASAKVMLVRDEARDAAVKTIRGLETRLVEAIAGDTLRGLTDLVPNERGVGGLQAIRIHPSPRTGLNGPLDDRWVTIITKEGTLARAHRCPRLSAGWESYPCPDDELVAQDLEPYARAVQHVLERHIARAERTAANYLKVTLLATKLANVIG